MIFAVEPADIANLSAGIGVERRVIKDDLAALAGLQLLHADAGADPVPLMMAPELRMPVVSSLVIALEDRLRQMLDTAGFAVAFEPPFQEACARWRCSSMAASKPTESKKYSSIAAGVFDEVAGQSEGVIQAETHSRPDRLPPFPLAVSAFTAASRSFIGDARVSLLRLNSLSALPHPATLWLRRRGVL